jgi:hypothetical protein
MDLKTNIEIILRYTQSANLVQESIQIFSNEQKSLLHASVKNERETIKHIELDSKLKLNCLEHHSTNVLVTLNVGGMLFATFKDTLMRFEYSYFYGLLNSGNFLPGPDGSYFIDRSPAHFELIMGYLRTGKFTKKKLTTWEIEELKIEFDYFLLPIPIELKPAELEWDSSILKKAIHASFSDDNLKITKISGKDLCNFPVIGSITVSEFTVEYISGGCVMIGLCPINQFLQNGASTEGQNVCTFSSNTGYIIYNGSRFKTSSSELKVNDKLTVIKNGPSIRFLKNGVDVGVDINNAPREMYPLVQLVDVGSSVMIVRNGC